MAKHIKNSKYCFMEYTEKMQYSKDIENRLFNLISSLKGVITKKTIKEATKYLEHREWGICLQYIGYDYIELKLPITEVAYTEIMSLYKLMDIPNTGDKWFYEKLIERHTKE